jgi:hypothetical protein
LLRFDLRPGKFRSRSGIEDVAGEETDCVVEFGEFLEGRGEACAGIGERCQDSVEPQQGNPGFVEIEIRQ